MDGRHVEEQNEADKDDDAWQEADPEQDQFPLSVVQSEGDEGHDGIGCEEAKDESKQVGIVVNPWQQPRQKEDCRDTNQLENGHLGIFEAGPLMNHLHDTACQQTKVSTRRPNLSTIGNKDGAGKVAYHPAAQVDDTNPLGPRHLLQVPHQPELEGDGDQQVDNAENGINIKSVTKIVLPPDY